MKSTDEDFMLDDFLLVGSVDDLEANDKELILNRSCEDMGLNSNDHLVSDKLLGKRSRDGLDWSVDDDDFVSKDLVFDCPRERVFELSEDEGLLFNSRDGLVSIKDEFECDNSMEDLECDDGILSDNSPQNLDPNRGFLFNRS